MWGGGTGGDWRWRAVAGIDQRNLTLPLNSVLGSRVPWLSTLHGQPGAASTKYAASSRTPTPPPRAQIPRHNNPRLSGASEIRGPVRRTCVPAATIVCTDPAISEWVVTFQDPSSPAAPAAPRASGLRMLPEPPRAGPAFRSGVGEGREASEKGHYFPRVAGRRQAEGRGAHTL